MKKGQSWFLDLFFGIMIFTIAFTVLMKSNINLNTSEDQLNEDMASDGKIISDMLLTTGIPDNWNTTDVISPGLISDGRINSTKVMEFENLGYNVSRTLLRSRFDFIFFISNESDIIPIGGVKYFGKPGVGPDNITAVDDPDIVLKVMRLAVFNSTVVRLEVILWQ